MYVRDLLAQKNSNHDQGNLSLKSTQLIHTQFQKENLLHYVENFSKFLKKMKDHLKKIKVFIVEQETELIGLQMKQKEPSFSEHTLEHQILKHKSDYTVLQQHMNKIPSYFNKMQLKLTKIKSLLPQIPHDHELFNQIFLFQSQVERFKKQEVKYQRRITELQDLMNTLHQENHLSSHI